MQIVLSIYLNPSTCKYLSLDNGVTMTSKRRENINLVSFICLSFLQRLPVTRALQRLFPISKTKFWWTSIKCIHDNSRVHFVSVSRRCSIVVGSGIIADKVICNFAEMEGYYVEKTWSVFESHSRNTFCEWNVCEEGGVSIVRKQS